MMTARVFRVLSVYCILLVSVSCDNPAAGVRVAQLRLSPNDLSLVAGETESLFAEVLPGNAADRRVEWASTNPAVADVSPEGLVTAISIGSATITAASADGRTTAGCTVSVLAGFLSADVSVRGNGTVVLEPEINPAGESETFRLRAVPDPDHRFAGWRGDLETADNPLRLNLHDSLTLVAVFEPVLYYRDGDVLQLLKGRDGGPRIVFLGDGYTQEDLAPGGVYETAGREAVVSLLSRPPFVFYRSHFSACIAFVRSEQRGADSSPSVDSVRTALDSTFGYHGIQRLLVAQDRQQCDRYILNALGSYSASDIVLLSVNDPRYGGSGGYYSTFSRHPYGHEVMAHEVGHSFGGLGDEYVDEAIQDVYSLSRLDRYPNLDVTDNLSAVKWSRYVGLEGYQTVGVFEGGYYRKTGIFRPEYESIMVTLSNPRFNAPGREAIVRKILGDAFDFEEFLVLDRSDLSVEASPRSLPFPGEEVPMPVPYELYAGLLPETRGE